MNQQQQQEHFPQPFRILSLIQLSITSTAISLNYYYHHQQQQQQQQTTITNNNNKTITTATATTTSTHQQLYYGALSLLITILLGLLTNQLLIHLLLIPPAHAPLLASIPAFILLVHPFRLAPFSAHFRNGHRKLLKALRRILALERSPQRLTRFPDLIIADLLTSLARPFADLALLCATTLHLHPSLQSSLSIFFNSLPYLLRFKQCMNDLIVGPNNKLRCGLNALKYSTAIPMIIMHNRLLSQEDARRGLQADAEEISAEAVGMMQDGPKILQGWVLACLLNSLYSSYWDIVNDWGISLSQIRSWYHHHHSHHHHPHHHHHYHQVHRKADLEEEQEELAPSSPSGQAPNRLLFPGDRWWIYVAVIVLNLALRHTWIIALFTTSHHSGPKLSFLLQALELLRRAIWILVRLEWAELSSAPRDLKAAYNPLLDGSPSADIDDHLILDDRRHHHHLSLHTRVSSAPDADLLPLLPPHHPSDPPHKLPTSHPYNHHHHHLLEIRDRSFIEPELSPSSISNNLAPSSSLSNAAFLHRPSPPLPASSSASQLIPLHLDHPS
ncbi:hypothetical protein PGTUg99_002320 [Puccinia graminis f. sp. tritici]|uniref:EXS domain-containing protein n=1 Tax=Puccinia graminis f. sp. tritici TaxID=56615 RepID=A0A5B0S9L4_PUCGR|nr:hypothetical protein PGTUg99_002320 [Puccinia graminis f. sp. tritici]